jgi:hypothetical protein
LESFPRKKELFPFDSNMESWIYREGKKNASLEIDVAFLVLKILQWFEDC